MDTIKSGIFPTRFLYNQRVSLKSNPVKKGRIDHISEPSGGYQYYDVLWDDGNLQILAEHELREELKINTPWDLLANNTLSDYRDFSIATTYHKVKNTTSNTISSLKASRTLFKSYQFKPLVKLLNSDLKRILIADEVGLGKTIEAGHIMLELAARGDLRNVLVICPNSLQNKWKMELQEKFNFTLKKYENPKEIIQDIENDTIASKRSIFGILNYEKCRNVNLLKAIEDNNYKFDLLICDEAHKIRNNKTAQHKGVAKIVDQSDAVVFLTATPIMTDLKNLHSLIKLLDNVFDEYDIFNNAIRQNRPFIRILNKLNSKSDLKQIAEELDLSTVLIEMTADEEIISSSVLTVGELFKDDDLYQRALNNLQNGPNSPVNIVKIQQDLTELNSLNSIYTRTRKKDVMSDKEIVKRNPHTVTIPLTEEERMLYDSVLNSYNDKNLGLMQQKRQMSSCIAAYHTPRNILENGGYNSEIPDSKFAAFKEYIVDRVVLMEDKKLIVFAFFTDTLLYLRNRLKELNIGTEIIYGAIKDRTERIDNFQNNPDIKILLSSEVGSEGLDLQFCDALVNYDLPWNPMVVEQRIGRIDRVGQQSEIINIFSLVIEDTIEEKIYQRLYERINLFRESLGALEDILGVEEPLGELIVNGIESLYKTKLTDKEQEEKLEQLVLAIENNKQTLEKVRLDLNDAFANDLHFQNEIEAIEKNKRYLTKEEIMKFIESIIRLELSSLQISHIDSNTSIIEIPSNSKTRLFDFVEKYKDTPEVNPELESLYRKFKRHMGEKEIKLTFDQQFAYEHKTVEYISAFHPLVNAITNYFGKNDYTQNIAHRISLRKEHILLENEHLEGYYILAVYKIIVKKDSGDGKVNTLHFLKSALADLNGDQVRILDKTTSDQIYGAAQLFCEQYVSDVDFEFDNEFVKMIRNPLMNEMKLDEEEIREDEEIKFISSVKRRTEQELRYLNSRIDRIKDQLAGGKGIEAILRKNIDDYTQSKDKLLHAQENAKAEISHSLISINFLRIL